MRVSLALVVMAATLLTACELLPARTVVRMSDEERLRVLERAVAAEIGDAPAEHAAQCKTIAFGAKPCGGPWKYLAYSTAATDEELLASLVREHGELQAEINLKQGLASDCMYVTDPGAALDGGRCILVDHN